MVSLLETTLAAATRQAIFEAFFRVASRGFDVQDFDPQEKNRGTKPTLSAQRGYYGEVDGARVRCLAELLSDILEAHKEEETLDWFDTVRRLPQTEGTDLEAIPSLRILRVLPDVYDDLNLDDLRSPNGLRIPRTLQGSEAVRNYSAKLLLPKLVLSAMAGLCGMSPWRDRDMDLGSAVHTIRPDRDKLKDGSGYGAANLPCHTDGYWSDDSSSPIWNVMYCANNEYDEPTRFIRVADIFRILEAGHRDFDSWVEVFRDLIPRGQKPAQFVDWVVQQSMQPQFEFVIGKIGRGSGSAVRDIPLLEKHAALPGYRFRYKRTFSTHNAQARPAVDFVNRMVRYLTDDAARGRASDVSLKPGAVIFALNGTCMQLCRDKPSKEVDCRYPVKGSATIHGRRPLRIVDGGVKRTLIRGNMVVTQRSIRDPQPNVAGNILESRGRVWNLLQQGYRANHLER